MRGALGAKSWPVPTSHFAPESTKFQDGGRTIPAVANDAPIGSWSNLLGSNHAGQATDANRPLLKTAVLNGFDVVQTDGVNDSLTAAIVAAAASTYFLVAKKVGAVAAAEDTLLGIRQSTSNRLRPFVAASTRHATQYQFFADEAVAYVQQVGSDATQWQVLALTATAGEAKTYAAGALTATFNPHDTVTTSNLMQFGGDNTTNFGDYQIAEVRRYSSVLSQGDLDLIGEFLADKYALTWVAA